MASLTLLNCALDYAERGWPVFPLCWPTVSGVCGCGRHRNPKKKRAIGKAPLTPHGVLDANTNHGVISAWWSQWPDANIGIDIKGANLFIIAPDSPEWLTEFKRRGLSIPIGIVRSGGGDGHFHFYYRRPPGCPHDRINKPGEYDIMTTGYVVAPPSLHQSGRSYLWL